MRGCLESAVLFQVASERWLPCLRIQVAQMGTTTNGSMRSSAGCRYSVVISLYSAHTGTTEGSPLPPYTYGISYRPALTLSPFLCAVLLNEALEVVVLFRGPGPLHRRLFHFLPPALARVRTKEGDKAGRNKRNKKKQKTQIS